MHWFDWTIAIIALSGIFVVSLNSRKRPVRASDKFTAGRSLPWVFLGGSLAATTLSTDTPLLVTGAFYADGLRGNWFWLATIPGFMATLFFFARFWQRSGVITEIEILSLRYGSSHATRTLRVARALLDGVLINVLILSSVTLGASLLLEGLFGLPDAPVWDALGISLSMADLLLAGLVSITVTYTLIAGFSAVVTTDLIQLVVAIGISLAITFFGLQVAISEFGSVGGFFEAIPNRDEAFQLIDLSDPYILVLLLVGWWILPGNGLIVQRLISARSEWDATATLIWFSFLHFFLRAWPWFIIGALALVYAPSLANGEQAFPAMATQFLPAGGLGLMAVAFWSAYMSTLDSRLNWGASYVVNDCLGERLTGDTQKIQTAERVTVIALALSALLLTWTNIVESIIGVYQYLMILQAGTAFTAMARWYWWRLSIRAEWVSFILSILLGNVLVLMIDLGNAQAFALAVAINAIACGVAAALVSWFWQASLIEQQNARDFHAKTQVPGPGWSKFQTKPAGETKPIRLLEIAAYWLLSTSFIYAIMSVLAGLVAGSLLTVVIWGGMGVVSAGILYARRKSLAACLKN